MRAEEKVRQRMRWLNGITESMYMSLSKLWQVVKDRVAWHAAVNGITKSLYKISTFNPVHQKVLS